MGEKTKLSLRIGAAALLLGLAGNGLMRGGGPPGLNAFLWVTAAMVSLVLLSRYGGVPLAGEGRWLLIPAVATVAAFLGRDSEAVLLLNVLGLFVCIALILYTARSGSLRGTGLVDYALNGLAAGCLAVVGPFFLLLEDVKWSEIPRSKWSGPVSAVLRGLLIAIPLLLIFGGLFMAADAVFENMVTRAISFNLGEVIEHVVVTGFWAWLGAGFLRMTLHGRSQLIPPIGRPTAFSLGQVELGIVLGLLNALFLAFVAVQFRYFFGGAALVEASTGLTYAEYARRGFFELVGVTALVLPLLLLLHWLLPAEAPRQERMFRWLAGSLVAMLCVIMISALQRMRLYQQEFGLTELRLYATIFMLWLGVLFVWFSNTVLRGQRDRFAFGALVTGLALVIGLQVLSPDALIVRTNLKRLDAGLRFDGAYAASLSAEVVPSLVDALPRMDAGERAVVAEGLLNRWGERPRGDWRSWNWGRSRAYATVEQNRNRLLEAAGRK